MNDEEEKIWKTAVGLATYLDVGYNPGFALK
jgi:hypothetical protein